MMFLALTLLLSGCAPKVTPVVPTLEQAPAHAPLPFTASQIREAMPTGTRIRFSLAVNGGPPVFQEWLVTDNTELDVEIEFRALDGAGVVIDGPARDRDAWEALKMHAAFPAANTARMEARLETPMGPYDCWLYQVERSGPDGQPQTERFWFARTLPGPPVRWETSRGGEVVQLLAMVERSLPR